MSYASGTTHYNLPQTVGTDKRDWTDTNQAFSDVDTALYGAVQDAETATQGIQTINAALEVINEKLSTDEGNISTISGKVSTLESTVGTQGTAIADVRQDLQDNIESNHEASATSTHLYNVGDTFYYNDVLYRATAQIAIGGTIVPSTNCTAITVMSEIDAINNPEFVSVTATGSETYSAVLDRLFGLLDMSKVNAHSRLTSSLDNSTLVLHVETITATSLSFVRMGGSDTNLNARNISLTSSGSSWKTVTIDSNGLTGENLTNTNMAANTVLKLYYK